MPFPFACPHCGATYRIKEELAGKRAKCKKCDKAMDLKPPEPKTSEGGSVIYQHQPRERGFELASGDSELIEAVEAHIVQHLGKYEVVWHEIVSDMVHVDVHVISPRKDRPWTTLVTSGMSERPMTTPAGVDDCDYAELFLCLPPTWPLDEAALEQEKNYWPIHMLKWAARMPHEYETWVCHGHTLPNGDPAAPYCDGTPFCCLMVAHAIGVPDDFARLEVPDGRVINFYSVLPLYKEEMDFKLKKGSEALMEKFGPLSVEDMYDPKRQNVCKKRFGLF